jgi:hypothetical protein
MAPTPEEAAKLFRVCERLDADDQPRCRARQLERSRKEWGLSNPRDAQQLYDSFDLGQFHLRTRLKEERRREFAQSRRTRTTYRQFQPTDDVNTRRRPYINDLRQRRLDCMLESPGRPRKLCFDKLTGDARKLMKRERGSNQYPAR